jgi:hypothetical protein
MTALFLALAPLALLCIAGILLDNDTRTEENY